MFQNFLHDVPFVVQCLIAAAAAMVIGVLLGAPMRRLGVRLNIMDVPNRRSSHTRTVPRTGGVAIVLAMLVAAVLFGKLSPALLVAVGLGAVAGVISFIDDTISLPSVPRLLVHLTVAGIGIYWIGLQPAGLELPYATIPFSPWFGVVFAAVVVTAFVNFFNFMDGINGIAISQGVVGGATLAILLAACGASNSAIVAAALVGGCLGFLPYNFPRAVMFMGDMGSTTIGLALAMMTLLGAKHWPWVACLMPLGVFIYDAIFTVVKRLLRRENILKAHREHHYQLLIRSGWSHVRVTSLQFGLMLLCGGAALVYAWADDHLARLIVLLVLLTVFVTYSVLVHRHFARHGT